MGEDSSADPFSISYGTADDPIEEVGWPRAGEAIEAGDEAAFRQVLLDFPALLRDFYVLGSLLNGAVEHNRPKILALMLATGVDADLIDESGGTPLIHAAWLGHLEVAQQLLAAGADPNHVIDDDHRGDPGRGAGCALLFALVKRHEALVDLLEPLTDPDLCDRVYHHLPGWLASREANKGLPPPTVILFMAAQANEPLDRLRDAIAACGDVNHMLEPEASNAMLGSTPLSFAAGRGRLDMVELLLADGADPSL